MMASTALYPMCLKVDQFPPIMLRSPEGLNSRQKGDEKKFDSLGGP
jgi:hypothetical protein